MNETAKSPHSFKYEAGKMVITGVISVDNYDDKSMELRINDGLLTLRGRDFVLEEMEVKSGIVILSGVLHSTDYHAKAEKVGLLNRIFK